MAKYDITHFTNVIATSTTFQEVKDRVPIESENSYARTIARFAALHSIPTEHLQRNVGKFDSDVFFSERKCSRSSIKRRILDEDLIPYECETCEATEWQGVKLHLDLDHINGNPNDHRLENLRFLCPNCHSITPTYRWKNRKLPIKHNYKCVSCGEPKNNRSPLCHPCYMKTDFVWPSNEDLSLLIWSHTMREVGENLCISWRAVTDRCKAQNIEIPPVGYWVCIAAGYSREEALQRLNKSPVTSEQSLKKTLKTEARLALAISKREEANLRRENSSVKVPSLKKSKIPWPSREELRVLIWTYPMITLAAQLGCSDRAVKKRCDRENIEPPPFGYWRCLEVGMTKEKALKTLEFGGWDSDPHKFLQRELSCR